MFFNPTLVVAALLAGAHALEFGAASHQEETGVDGLVRRHNTKHKCKKIENPTCETSCGKGFETCVHPDMCFNPGRGESCCPNGKFCPPGTYCTELGCCPKNKTPEDCKTWKTWTVVHPTRTVINPSVSTREPEPTTTSTTRTRVTSQTTITRTRWTSWESPEPSTEVPSSTVVPSSSEAPSSQSTPDTTTTTTSHTVIPSSATGTGSWPSTSSGTNATVTTPSQPPQQTDNGAAHLQGASAAVGLGLMAILATFL